MCHCGDTYCDFGDTEANLKANYLHTVISRCPLPIELALHKKHRIVEGYVREVIKSSESKDYVMRYEPNGEKFKPKANGCSCNFHDGDFVCDWCTERLKAADKVKGKPIWVGVVTFRREKLSKYEQGIAIGNNPDDIWRIVDKEFQPVVPYSLSPNPHKGCFWTEL